MDRIELRTERELGVSGGRGIRMRERKDLGSVREMYGAGSEREDMLATSETGNRG